MNTNEIAELEKKYEMNLYPKRGIALARGEGEFVWDAEGKKYIDCTLGLGGHAQGILDRSSPDGRPPRRSRPAARR